MKHNIFYPVKIHALLPLKLIKAVRTLCIVLGFGAGIGYIVSLYLIGLPSNLFAAAFFILTPIGVMLGFFEIFLHFYIFNPPLDENSTTEDRLNFHTRRVFLHAYNLPPQGSITIPDLTLALLHEAQAQLLWIRMGINPETVDEFFTKAVQEQKEADRNDLEELAIMQRLETIRVENKTDLIGLSDLLIVLFDEHDALQQFLQQQNIDRDDLHSISSWEEAKRQYRKKLHFWTSEHQLRRRPFGLDWAYGYTPTLQRFANDISYQFEGTNRTVWLVGRDESINQLERILIREGQNNALLVGPPGVGKRTLVYGLAQRIAQGASLPELKFKRVFELDMGAIRSSGDTVQHIEGMLRAVLHDANEAGNVILFINNIEHSLGVDDTGAVGALDVSAVLQPYLDSSNIRIIGSITQEGYHDLLETRPAMLKAVEIITMSEPSPHDTTRILQTLVPSIEHSERIFITHHGLKEVVQKSDLFVHDKPFPEKAIDLLNEVVAYVHTRDKNILTQADVDAVVSQKTNIPLGALQQGEKDKIKNLDALLHEHIVNQEQAVTQLSRTVMRLRAGITSTGKPAGSFLFIGPTGVGKTLTAQTLATVYYGNEANMIRFDMSEFQTTDALDHFLGSPRTNEKSRFLTAVHDRPYSIILLDEFEKAHPSIHNLFLQILDEGMLTDAFDKKVSLKQNIIIATSNAGSEYIRTMVQKNIDPSQQKNALINYMLEQRLFRPELMNRFDDVIVFHPLTQEHVQAVAKKLLNRLASRLFKQNYELTITDDLITYVAQTGYSPEFGARSMRRVIQDTVEVAIANQIINGTLQKGMAFTIDPTTFS